MNEILAQTQLVLRNLKVIIQILVFWHHFNFIYFTDYIIIVSKLLSCILLNYIIIIFNIYYNRFHKNP
jgi:hypothetical protein